MRTIFTFALLLVWLVAWTQNEPKKYKEYLDGTDLSIQMVPIPEGSFMIGEQKTKEADEKPQKEVKISPFWMSSFEITHNIFMVYRDPNLDVDLDGNPRVDGISRPSQPYEDPTFGMGKDGFPAVGMTQFSALQFCKWLSEKTGNFYRLPTEAEWEYACRAGTDTPYFFGKSKKMLGDYAWFDKNCEGTYHKVGSLSPNPWELYDMLGNVAEWTLDQYHANYYSTLEDGQMDPKAPLTALHPRTVRGGSYLDNAKDLRCANRLESSLDWKKRDPQIPKSFWWNTDSPFVGFRIIRPVNAPSAAEQKAFWEMVLGG